MSHPSSADGTSAIDYVAVAESPAFLALRRSQRGFVFPMAVFFLLWYIAYVVAAAYAHEFMATPVLGMVNLGLVLGLLQFVTTFAITSWYVSFANRRLDPAAADLRAELEAMETRSSRTAAEGVDAR